MSLLIRPARDGRYNTYVCRGSDCQIEPLSPDVFDVASDVLEIVRDIITVSVHLVDIYISLLKFYTQGFQDGKALHCRQQAFTTTFDEPQRRRVFKL